MDAKKPATEPSKTFLLVSLILVFPLLVLIFGQIFDVFLLRLLALVLPADVVNGWPMQIAFWLLAGLAALTVCRMLLRANLPRGSRGDSPR